MINTWLERRDPVIRPIDIRNCATLAEWRGEALRKLFDVGILELDCLLESALLFLGTGKSPMKKFAHNC
jgi:hypothetical protein